MNISKQILTLLLLCFILAAFSSCQKQVKSKASISDTAIGLGCVVTGIDTSIWVIFQDKKNRHWFGSNGNGVYCYDGKNIKQFTTKDGLCSNRIRGIQEDKSGNIYFDTPDGVSKFDGAKITSLISVRSSANQWRLRPDDLWFRYNGGLNGASRYDGDTLYQLEFSKISSIGFSSDCAVYSIYKDRQGFVWFGTLGAGVCRFDGRGLQWIFEEELGVLKDGRAPAIRSIIEDKEGYFWFSNLLYQYNILNTIQKTIGYERVNRIDLAQQSAQMELPYYTSAVLDNETIWMTNYSEGVWKFDGEKLTNYRLKDGETNVLTMFVYKDNAGSIWLGTDNAGVYRFNGAGFEKFKP
ncbi:MAG: ligand-binding sensor domain-containing protein [Bacteroidia bacterium]